MVLHVIGFPLRPTQRVLPTSHHSYHTEVTEDHTEETGSWSCPPVHIIRRLSSKHGTIVTILSSVICPPVTILRGSVIRPPVTILRFSLSIKDGEYTGTHSQQEGDHDPPH